MRRRSLLQALVVGSGALALDPLLHIAATQARSASKVLVLVDLQGGNDGLNTLAPIGDARYQRARPTLALGPDAPLLGRGLALHPSLAPLLPLWTERRLSFALGVGWPEPSRSHFKAADQWATGRDNGLGAGWLARAFADHQGGGPLVSLDGAGSAAMEGGSPLALQITMAEMEAWKPSRFEPSLEVDSVVLRKMLELEVDSRRVLAELHSLLAPLPPRLALPRGRFGQQVALALRLIGSGICPPVLHLALGGFDTHARQAERHANVLQRLAQGLLAFEAGLKLFSKRPEVTLLAVSEFGRRLQENGSRGTDHGSASVALLYGDGLPSPFLGHYPDLGRLDGRGDLIPTLQPSTLYVHVLKGFEGVKN